MTLHFEDRQRLRVLAQPVLPQHDLWPAIAAHLDVSSRKPRSRLGWLAVAAALSGVAILAGVIGIRTLRSDSVAQSSAAQSHAQMRTAATDRNARSWHPNDPRLRGAAVELRAAQGELQQALAIAPHSPYLQRLLDNTQQQQTRLRRMNVDAG